MKITTFEYLRYLIWFFFRDGAICSGILCAFFHSVEQVTIDDEIDLFQTVRQLNVRRPQFIQRLVSYFSIFNEIKKIYCVG